LTSWSTAIFGVAGIAACQLYVLRVLKVDLRRDDKEVDLPPRDWTVDLRPHDRKTEFGNAQASISEVDLAQSDQAAPRGLRITPGGLLLWAGTICIGISTVVLLAALSRHLHHEEFTGLSTLFGLFFVASLIPAGIPLRSAALAVDGAPPMRMTAPHVALLAIAGTMVSPFVAYALHLPVLAVLFVAVQVIVAIPLAIRRGSLIAAHRFAAVGGNLFLESAMRIALGTLAGLAWGLNGLSLGLAVATAITLIAVPSQESSPFRTVRQMTSLVHTWLAVVLLGLFVQLDILISPSVLTHSEATRYDLAAVPSKGVYLVLIAVSWLIFPHVRVHAQRRTVVLAAAATCGIGLVVTGALVALRDTIGAVLGQNVASLPLLIVLGVAMSIGGATGIVINGGIALGVARPWPPLVPGIACLLACWFVHPSALVFGIVVLAAQAGTLLITAWVCLRKRPAPVPLPALT
jgi:hypothetical protein